MSKAKSKKFPLATVPSCVAALSDAELVCFHGIFDIENDDHEEEENEDGEQERGFYISSLNAKTFKIIKTTKLELTASSNLEDLEGTGGADPCYALMTISPSKRYLAITVGHEDYTAALIVDLSDMSVKHVEESADQHDQVRVVFLSDTAALISSCGHEYSPWRKVTSWSDEAAGSSDRWSEDRVMFRGSEEEGTSFLMLGSNADQTQYAVRRRYLPEEHKSTNELKNYREEILFYDIDSDELVRTISLGGRPLASNVAISGDFNFLWDWLGTADYRGYCDGESEAKIWRTDLSGEIVQLSGGGVATDVFPDTPCNFISVDNAFFKQSLCDGKVEDEGEFQANIQLTYDKGHFVIGNGAGVFKIFSANTGVLEVSTKTGTANTWNFFQSPFYREQHNAVLCNDAPLLLFGFDSESARSVFSVAVPVAAAPKLSRRGGNVAAVAPAAAVPVAAAPKLSRKGESVAAVAPAAAASRGVKRQLDSAVVDSVPDTTSAYLECCEGTSNKFYRIEVIDDCSVVCHYGPIGAGPGNRIEKKFASPEEASAFALKTAKEKRSKGYIDAEVPATEPAHVAAPDGKKATAGGKGSTKAAVTAPSAAIEEKSAPPQKVARKNTAAPAAAVAATATAPSAAAAAGNAYLECKEGTSNKFYRIETTSDSVVICHYGAIASKPGVRIEKSFDTYDKAVAHAEQVAKEKRKKGYTDSVEM